MAALFYYSEPPHFRFCQVHLPYSILATRIFRTRLSVSVLAQLCVYALLDGSVQAGFFIRTDSSPCESSNGLPLCTI